MRIILLDYLEDSEKVMTAGALATRSSKVAADISPTDKQVNNMIKWTKEMKLSSVLDFSYYIFSIEGVSRSFTHQWVRYRIAAHMQQSLRYVKINTTSVDWFVVPPSITKNGVESVMNYIRNQIRSGQIYLDLILRGVPPEDARFALPIGIKTHLSSAFNAEEMIHIIYQRTCFDAQWEIRTVAYAILLAGLIVHPKIFDQVGPSCMYEGVCRGVGKWKCFKDAEEIWRKVVKRGKEARSEFSSLDREEFLKIDLTDILGYHAPENIVREVEKELGMPINLDIDVLLEVKKK